jgi:hypothetical protein
MTTEEILAANEKQQNTVGKKPNLTSLEKYKYQQSLAERALIDGPFRDELWDLLLKIEASYETREGMIQILEKRIHGIPVDYNYTHFITERDELRGPEDEVDPDEDPAKSVTPFSTYTFRAVGPRAPP